MARLYTTLCILALFVHASFADPVAQGRRRRSDDNNPLEAVVSGLSQKVDALTAQLGALNSRLQSQDTATANQFSALQNSLDDIGQEVGFTARYSDSDVLHLGDGQTLKFDNVLYNAGHGYNPNTGVFTAPVAGTYAFFINVVVHKEGTNGCIQMNLYHGSTFLISASACNVYLNSGSNMAVHHLEAGDTVHVQASFGDKLHGDHSSFSGMKL